MAAGRKIIKPDIKQELFSIFGGGFKEKEMMSKHTTLCLGGPADYFVEVKNEKELILVIKAAKKDKIPFYVIGGGSNLLFEDKGFNGLIIKLTGEFRKTEVTDGYVVCGSGALLSEAVKKSTEYSLSGLEYFIAIPGTVGGAVYGNAGLKEIWIDSVIDTVETVNHRGQKQVFKRDEIHFKYRESGLENCVITKVRFVLKKADKNDILNIVSQEIERRIKSQPAGTKNAGCVFKNPQGDSAGRLIDSLGLKNYAAGGIKISDVHANFFINTGSGTANDMKSMIDFVKNKVKEKCNIDLKTEIKIIK
ncbi:MAG: UDP-N-acetylmuramate dehydrogenase [Endomicrobiaceae bacterium]